MTRSGDKGDLVRAIGDNGPYRQKRSVRVMCFGNVKTSKYNFANILVLLGRILVNV